MRDLSELLEIVRQRGYCTHFSLKGNSLIDGDQLLGANQVRLIDTESVDSGTDPGDDATVYLVKTDNGSRGYLVLPDGPHTDPTVAAFVDHLVRSTPVNDRF